MENLSELYEIDGYSWYMKNAQLIRERRFDEVDVDNLAEEVDLMAENYEDKLESALIILVLHLLKLEYRSDWVYDLASWQKSVDEQRDRVNRYIEKSTNLKKYFIELIKYEKVYKYSLKKAIKQAKLDIDKFPQKNPYTIEQLTQDDWYPSSNH
jgi:hypothetical protein